MRRELLVLTLMAGVLAGCGERVRNNPFDPGNPATGGRPAGFEALAGDGLVTLHWIATPSSGLRGYELFRKAGVETGFTQISGLISPQATSAGDFQLLNGTDHTYRLYFVFDAGVGGDPAEDVATPGPLVPWVADYGRKTATQLTADGRHTRTHEAFSGPADVAMDGSRGVLWVADTDGGRVVIVTPSTGRRLEIATFRTPTSLALDATDGSVWICDGGLDAVRHYRSDGSAASPFELSPLANPLDAELDTGDRSLWVCERDGARVRHYTSSGAPAGIVPVFAPSRVAVDSVTHAAWVTSFTHRCVYLLSNAPALRDSFFGFTGPIGIAVDPRRGRVWVADAAGGAVVALQRDGSEEFRVTGLGEPREIEVDRASGEAWVTLAGSGQIARISPSGTLVLRGGGMIAPYGISLGAP